MMMTCKAITITIPMSIAVSTLVGFDSDGDAFGLVVEKGGYGLFEGVEVAVRGVVVCEVEAGELIGAGVDVGVVMGLK